jgi:hypothetical protein
LINGWSTKLLSRWGLAGNLIRPCQSHASPIAPTNLGPRHVDIVLATGPEIALKSALATAGAPPMVMIAIDYDPLALGYVMSLARRRHRAPSPAISCLGAFRKRRPPLGVDKLLTAASENLHNRTRARSIRPPLYLQLRTIGQPRSLWTSVDSALD